VAARFEPELPNHYGLRTRYFDLGHQVQLVGGERDLFGEAQRQLRTHARPPVAAGA
jgi:hypothetical protein